MIAIPKFPMLDESRNVRHGFFEPADFEKVRARLAPEAYADAAAFAYITGWRLPSEVLTLDWSQVDMRSGLVHRPRHDEGRRGPPVSDHGLIAEGAESSEAHEGGRLRARVPRRRPADSQAPLHAAWTDACTAAKVDGRIPHDMRRSAVRNLERASIPRKVAMQMVGPRTESIYRRYHIVAEADIHDAGARLDAATSAKASTTKVLRFKKKPKTTKPQTRKIA